MLANCSPVSIGCADPFYLMRLSIFSHMFMAFTSAAARSDGEAFGSHTVLFASGPFTQSGKDCRLHAVEANRAVSPANEDVAMPVLILLGNYGEAQFDGHGVELGSATAQESSSRLRSHYDIYFKDHVRLWGTENSE